MGMFDYLTYNDKHYQTKSLDNGLCNYKIENGILYKEQAEYVWVDDESRFGGYLDKRNPHWVKSTYSGEIEFYRNLDKTYKTWEELIAFVIEGTIIKVVPAGVA
jgi:hypothetical protein